MPRYHNLHPGAAPRAPVKVEAPRDARLVPHLRDTLRGARAGALPDQSIEQRGLAHVGAAREGELRCRGRRQLGRVVGRAEQRHAAEAAGRKLLGVRLHAAPLALPREPERADPIEQPLGAGEGEGESKGASEGQGRKKKRLFAFAKSDR